VAAFARLLGDGLTDPGAEPHSPPDREVNAGASDRAAAANPRPSATSALAGRAATWLDGVHLQALGLANGMVLGASRIVPAPGLTMSVVRALLGVTRALAGRALSSRGRDDVSAAPLRLRVPMTPVNTPEESVAAEQPKALDYFRKTGFPHLGDAPMAAAPWRLSAPPAALRRPAPEPGENDGSDFVAPRSASG